MEKECDVLCIGLIVANLLVKPVNKSVFDVDVTMVNEIDILTGGDAMNEAAIFSKLGNRVGLVGKVGNDHFGKAILQLAQMDRVDIKNIKIDENVKTSVCIVLVNEKGDRNFLSYRGPNETLSVEDIDFSIIKKAKAVSIGSIFALPKLDRGGAELIFKEARANNVITAFDVKYDTYKLGFDGIKGLLGYTDFFLPSYDEAVYLTKEKEPEKIADILLGYGAKTIVIKLGGEGCYIKSSKESYLVEPYETEAIDTTGAGDNFVAGFLTGVLKGWDLMRCSKFANAVGSLSVKGIGATTFVKSMDQVIDYMNHF